MGAADVVVFALVMVVEVVLVAVMVETKVCDGGSCGAGRGKHGGRHSLSPELTSMHAYMQFILQLGGYGAR